MRQMPELANVKMRISGLVGKPAVVSSGGTNPGRSSGGADQRMPLAAVSRHAGRV